MALRASLDYREAVRIRLPRPRVDPVKVDYALAAVLTIAAQIEIWFGIITRQAIRRGTLRSVKDLNTKIRAFIDNWNDDRAHPFVRTKTADQILAKANRPTTSNSSH